VTIEKNEKLSGASGIARRHQKLEARKLSIEVLVIESADRRSAR